MFFAGSIYGFNFSTKKKNIKIKSLNAKIRDLNETIYKFTDNSELAVLRNQIEEAKIFVDRLMKNRAQLINAIQILQAENRRLNRQHSCIIPLSIERAS
jgi:predicted  nucleic acid-binding Zn-ribbon protein